MTHREMIAREMKAQGMTPTELARKADVSRSRLYDFLAERKSANIETVERLLAALKIKCPRP